MQKRQDLEGHFSISVEQAGVMPPKSQQMEEDGKSRHTKMSLMSEWMGVKRNKVVGSYGTSF